MTPRWLWFQFMKLLGWKTDYYVTYSVLVTGHETGTIYGQSITLVPWLMATAVDQLREDIAATHNVRPLEVSVVGIYKL